MRVVFADTVEEALDLLAQDPELVPFAGGTDLMVHWPQRWSEHDKTYLDLSSLDALRPIRWEDGHLVLGALTTFWDVVREPRIRQELPLLVTAARQVGAIQIQSRGTWAGNIVNASPAADGVPVLMAYDAVVELASRDGREEVALADFYQGYKVMRRRKDQLVLSIRIPRRDYSVQVFEKVGSRRAQAITKVGVALTRSSAGWRVVANSMAPTVCRCRTIERRLDEGARVASPDDLLPAIRADVQPIDDIRSTAAYRERVMARMLYWALTSPSGF